MSSMLFFLAALAGLVPAGAAAQGTEQEAPARDAAPPSDGAPEAFSEESPGISLAVSPESVPESAPEAAPEEPPEMAPDMPRELSEEEELEEERAEELAARRSTFTNALNLRPTIAYQMLRDRPTAIPEEAPDDEWLGGFTLAYERYLIPDHLSIEVAKPFLWNAHIFDTPLDLVVNGILSFPMVEFYLGVGATVNFRFLHEDRQVIEDEEGFLIGFGLVAVAGASVWVWQAWSLDLQFEYAYVPTSDDFVAHEFHLSLGPAFHFGS